MNPSNRVKLEFFVRRLFFESGSLTVWIGGEHRDQLRVDFKFVRSYFQFKESDFFEQIDKSDAVVVFDGGQPRIGIFEIASGSMITTLSPDRLLREEPSVYWVSTADECLEIMGFECPTVQYLEHD